MHLRTTNPIESTFATVRHRTKVTKGPGSKAAGVAMAFKLIEAAQRRWRAVNAPHLVALRLSPTGHGHRHRLDQWQLQTNGVWVLPGACWSEPTTVPLSAIAIG